MRWLGALVIASYLFAGCFLLPWSGEVKDKAEQIGQTLAETGAHPPEIDAHNCACDLSHDDRSPFYWCDPDGTRNPWGAYTCCADCNKVCGEPIRSMPKTGKGHVCSCDPDEDPNDPPARMLEPCDEGGKYKSDGEYWCCGGCHKVCGRRPLAEPGKRRPSPVPVPLPPDCPLEDHCRSKESCAIGGGNCCAKCKSACPFAGEGTP